MSNDLRYNPRTGEFEGADSMFRPRRRARTVGANGRPFHHSGNKLKGFIDILKWFCVGVVAMICWKSYHKQVLSTNNAERNVATTVMQQEHSDNRQKLKETIRETNQACIRCRGMGRVCTDCLGLGYYNHECKSCYGSGEKDVA